MIENILLPLMRWKELSIYNPKKFKRLTGVERSTFDTMTEVVSKQKSRSEHKISGSKRGPKPKLCVEDEILMMLMYYREYRTFLHIAADYGISEAQCWRIVTETEKYILKDSRFHLPGKKVLLSNTEIEVILVDASESPVERPKKTKAELLRKEKKAYTKDADSGE